MICWRREGRCAGRFADRPASGATESAGAPTSAVTIGSIMNEPTPRKPANRPSRRQDVIGAAVELLALQPWDMVTVADIVERAGMTPAAFYYHFSSREQLLQEIVEDFAETWVDTIDGQLVAADSLDQLCQVPVSLLAELEQSQQVARIFFLSAASAPLLVE